MIPPLIRSYLRKTWTATSDAIFMVSNTKLWFNKVDIFCYDNPAYLGDVTDQDVVLIPGDCYSLLDPTNIQDLFFKNYTPGSNTRIVISGNPMTQKQADNVGVKTD
jgi:hypothetical protein